MMLRSLRTVGHLTGSVLLLAGMIGLLEVGLRCAALQHGTSPVDEASQRITVPSASVAFELRPATVLRRRLGEKTIAVRTNSLGLRGPEPALPKPPGVFRVLCLGGPGVFGEFTEEAATFALQLQQRLAASTRYPVEVLNAGQPEDAPLLALVRLRQRLLGLQPDLLLVQVESLAVEVDARYRREVLLDPQGQPLACGHPTLQPARPIAPIAAVRREFRLVDGALHLLGREWDAAEAAEFRSQARRSPRTVPDAAALLTDPSLATVLTPLVGMQTLAQALGIPMAVMMTPARTVKLAEPSATPSSRHRSPRPIWPDDAFVPAAVAWLQQKQMIVWDARSSFAGDLAARSDGRDAWLIDEQSRLAEHAATALIAQFPGPWSSPYFQEPGVAPPAGSLVPTARRQPGEPVPGAVRSVTRTPPRESPGAIVPTNHADSQPGNGGPARVEPWR